MNCKSRPGFVAFVLGFAFLASVLCPAEGGDKPLCDPCINEALAQMKSKNVVLGSCPSCKTGIFIPVMDEKICHKCAAKRRVCARCLITRGWNDALDEVPRSAKNRIVFLSNRDGNNELYSMKPDGEDVVRLTEAASNEMDPAVSKDGRWIAFVSNRDGNWEIYMTDGKGSTLRRLTRTKGEENHPSWFPDGKRLVAVRAGGGYELVVLGRAGEEPVPLDVGEELALGFPEVSPDGKKIVFVGSKDSRNVNAFEICLWEMKDPENPAEGTLKRLTNTGCVDGYPSCSPDGKKITFVSNR
ncbi:MAG: hypothetical protein ACYS47_05330, partial [Planctomycetota bacterium]